MLLTLAKILVKTPGSAKLPNELFSEAKHFFILVPVWIQLCLRFPTFRLTSANFSFGDPKPRWLSLWSPLEKISFILLLCPVSAISHPSPSIPKVSSCLPKARKVELKLWCKATKRSAWALRIYPHHVEKGLGHSGGAIQTSPALIHGNGLLWGFHKAAAVCKTAQKPTTLWGHSCAKDSYILGSALTELPTHNWHHCVSPDLRRGEKKVWI